MLVDAIYCIQALRSVVGLLQVSIV